MAERVEVRGGDVNDVLVRDREPGDVLVVDPPRVGLGQDVCKKLLASGPDRIIYISCNPITQVADVDLLQAGYRIVAARGFDLFPQTFHVENVIVLERQ